MARSGEKYKINDLQYYVAIFVCYNYTMICKIDSIIGYFILVTMVTMVSKFQRVIYTLKFVIKYLSQHYVLMAVR